MSTYETLFHDECKGYVIRCEGCGNLQLDFRNLLLTFTLSDFEAFRCWVDRYTAEQQQAPDPNLCRIIMPTPAEGIKLLLSLVELRALNKMLELADAELQSLQLIRMFSENGH